MGFDPITIGMMTVLNTMGEWIDATGQASALKSQAAAAKYNAGMMETSAQVTRQQTVAQEEAQRRSARQVLGTQAAGLAQSGIGMSGSTHDVMEQSAILAELDALNIRYEGGLKAKELTDQAAISRAEAESYKDAARKALGLGILGTGANILTGIGTYRQYGAFNRSLAAKARVYNAA